MKLNYVAEENCPKCGCDLREERNRQQRLKLMEENPNICYCYSFDKRGKRDIDKDKFIEKRMVWVWTGPFTNTHRVQGENFYKCHKCGNEFIHPQILYA